MQVKVKIILELSSEQSTMRALINNPPPNKVSQSVIIRIFMCPYWKIPIQVGRVSGLFSGSFSACKYDLWKNKSVNKKTVCSRLDLLQRLQLLRKMFLTPCRW